jgi:predicted DNA-binding transcriptional regulator AlpA
MKFIGREGLRAKGIKFSRQHIHRLEKSPDPARRFPRHVNIGQNTIAWVEPEVDAWMEARAAERGAYIPPVPPEDVTGPAASTPPGRSRRGLTA